MLSSWFRVTGFLLQQLHSYSVRRSQGQNQNSPPESVFVNLFSPLCYLLPFRPFLLQFAGLRQELDILTVTGEQHYAGGLAAPLMVAHEISLISARLITSKSSFNEKEKSGLYKFPEQDHMTPILYSPNWLPAQFRMQFNFSKSLFEMTTTFKWPSGGHNTRPEDTWYSCGRTTSAMYVSLQVHGYKTVHLVNKRKRTCKVGAYGHVREK